MDLSDVAKHSEERRDVYISCTESVGLKVRGQSEVFEVKVRGQKYPCGAEEWRKLVHRQMTNARDKELMQQAFRELLQQQKHSLDPESGKSVEEALSIPWENQLLSISKHVTKGYVHGVSVEQTDLILSGELCSVCTKWRTVCFESHSVHKVEEMLQRAVKAKKVEDHLREVPDSLVQGYPAFVMFVTIEKGPK